MYSVLVSAVCFGRVNILLIFMIIAELLSSATPRLSSCVQAAKPYSDSPQEERPGSPGSLQILRCEIVKPYSLLMLSLRAVLSILSCLISHRPF